MGWAENAALEAWRPSRPVTSSAPMNAPGYSGPPMVSPNFSMTNHWAGVGGVGNPGQYTSGIYIPKQGSYYGQGIPLVKAGAHYTRGIDIVKGGDAYTRDVDMVKGGAHYFNDNTIDLVDKAGNYAGLEAEAGRTLSRMGGALTADQYGSGLTGGGLGRAMQQSLVAEVGGNLARDINADKFNREAMVQEGTLARQQGILMGDTSRMQGQQAQNQIRLQGDSARMQGQLARNNLELSGDTARQQGAISRQQLILAGDQARSGATIARSQIGLSAAQANSQASIARAQGMSSDQQFRLGYGQQIRDYNANNYWQGQQNWLAQEQLYQGNLQNPNYGNSGTGAK